MRGKTCTCVRALVQRGVAVDAWQYKSRRCPPRAGRSLAGVAMRLSPGGDCCAAFQATHRSRGDAGLGLPVSAHATPLFSRSRPCARCACSARGRAPAAALSAVLRRGSTGAQAIPPVLTLEHSMTMAPTATASTIESGLLRSARKRQMTPTRALPLENQHRHHF